MRCAALLRDRQFADQVCGFGGGMQAHATMVRPAGADTQPVPSLDGARTWSNPEHIGHGVEAGASPTTPERRLHRAAGEDTPVRRAMRELDALAIGGEDHGMLPDDVAATQGREPDVATPARAR